MSTLLCEQVGCPLLVDGTCLDGFEPPSECPHSHEDELDESDLAGLSDDVVLDQPVSADTVEVPGAQALTIAQAAEIVATYPATVVLLSGEAEAGKTTLIVELFAQYLEGPFAGTTFAGSRTLKAIDDRHFPARVSSGSDVASTARTQDPDVRFLHLELAQESLRHHLLVSDLRGELFENIANGAAASSQIPITSRADLCVLLIDGDHLRDAGSRAATLFRASQLLGGLSEPGALMTDTPVLVVCSKSDLLDEAQTEAVQRELVKLVEMANQRGLNAESMTLSARPPVGSVGPTNLDTLLSWLLRDRRSAAVAPKLDRLEGDRQAWHRTER